MSAARRDAEDKSVPEQYAESTPLSADQQQEEPPQQASSSGGYKPASLPAAEGTGNAPAEGTQDETDEEGPHTRR